MARPARFVRGAPTGSALVDGFRTKVAFGSNVTIGIREKAVTPAGYDGGPPVAIDDMHNVNWMVMRSQRLKTLTEMAFTFSYDPQQKAIIAAMINSEQSITVLFSDLSAVAFWGYLRVVRFNESRKGEQPTGTATIQPTNVDPSDNSEAGPVYYNSSGVPTNID